jgi:hypothetical protein
MQEKMPFFKVWSWSFKSRARPYDFAKYVWWSICQKGAEVSQAIVCVNREGDRVEISQARIDWSCRYWQESIQADQKWRKNLQKMKEDHALKWHVIFMIFRVRNYFHLVLNHIVELNKIDKMRGEGRLDGNIRNWRDIHIGTVTSLINLYWNINLIIINNIKSSGK